MHRRSLSRFSRTSTTTPLRRASLLRRSAVLAGIAGVVLLSSAAHAQDADEELPPLPAPPKAAWYELVQLSAFVDAYASINYNFPKPAGGANATTRAYDTDTGFALAWAGVDASFPADPVGGTLSLRWGPAADTYAGGEPGTLKQVKQAFASWKPGGADGSVTLDFGKFDTIYGAELAESWLNFNYTRGVVYWFAQPAFHTGLRVGWELSPEFTLRALAVNGWNNTVDGNTGKSFGAQAAWTPSDSFGLTVGWLGGPEQADVLDVDCADDTAYDATAGGCASSPNTPAATYRVDRGGANDPDAWRHLIDAVLTWNPSDSLGFVVNVDYGWEGIRQSTASSDTTKYTWLGAMAAGRYAFNSTWGIALRGEYFKAYGEDQGDLPALSGDYYPFGVPDLAIGTGTLTLDFKPTDNLIIRLENRGDFALDAHSSVSDDAKKIFPKKQRETADSQITTTLGVVVTTN
ncbi:MAG: porin [Polyangiaceae bacterium]